MAISRVADIDDSAATSGRPAAVDEVANHGAGIFLFAEVSVTDDKAPPVFGEEDRDAILKREHASKSTPAPKRPGRSQTTSEVAAIIRRKYRRLA
jgi:hypothetical protein